MQKLKSYSVIALDDFPLVKPGDDLPVLIAEALESNGVELEDGDVLVVAQKIFSKSENRVVSLENVSPSSDADELAQMTLKDPKLVELVLRESRKVLKASPETILVEDVRGSVCINAGIDKSNVEGDSNFALLPIDPDESARKCRSKIRELTGRNVAVIMTDTYSRPFRRGQVNFAIGIAGINPFRDYRGKQDLFGHLLKVKNVAVADEIAAASELVMGQGQERTPVIVFKGLKQFVEGCEKCATCEMSISISEDLFKGAL